jgi:hypothetical protein
MFNRLRKISVTFLVTATSSCFVATANAGQTYSISQIASSSASGGLGLSLPSINDSGTVAFVNTSPGTNGIYTGNGGPISTILTSTTDFHLYFAGGPGAPTINNAGTVAFWAYLGPSGGSNYDLGILSGTAGNLSPIVSYPPPIGSASQFAYTTTPQISSNGTVAFAVTHIDADDGGGVYTGNGGALTTLTSNAASDGPTSDPAISKTGVVAYDSPNLNANNSRNGNDSLFTVNGNTTTPAGTITSDFFSHIAVNNSGTVAASTEGHRIYVSSGGNLQLFVSNISAFSEDDAVSINDSGEIAFFADLSAGGSGIFTGPDPVLDKVVETGDALDGSTILALGFGSEGLNNSGEIAFWAKLANGQQGEFVASIPEPSSAVVMLLAAGGILFQRLPNRRRAGTSQIVHTN